MSYIVLFEKSCLYIFKIHISCIFSNVCKNKCYTFDNCFFKLGVANVLSLVRIIFFRICFSYIILEIYFKIEIFKIKENMFRFFFLKARFKLKALLYYPTND